jgi:cyclopropane fatty-acyl-phospholipid synthase-like methyltransferase
MSARAERRVSSASMACIGTLSQTRVVLTSSEACERNKGPILAVLSAELAGSRRVLEIGSGTGQHAVHFAAGLPELLWQPSEVPQYLAPLAERIARAGTPNLAAPIALDVRDDPWPAIAADAVFSANTLHIMSWQAVELFFRGVGAVLGDTGALCVYGPFRYGGRHTSASNDEFDAYLRRRDPESGVRDFEALERLAREQRLELSADHAMPANNRTLVWRRRTAQRPE